MTWMEDRTVVVPIDMSEFSLKAVQTADSLVPDRKQLRIIYVLPVIEPAEPGVLWTTIDERERLEHADEALAKFLEDHGYSDLDVETRLGDAGHEIVAYAEEIDAGLIVISSHGRNVFQRMLLGSVTDRVVHLGHCPILVLKEKRDSSKQEHSESK